MRGKTFIFILSFLLIGAEALAQQEAPFSHWGIGVMGGTSGAGIEVGTQINNKFSLRVGYLTMPKFSVTFDCPDLSMENSGSIPSELTSLTKELDFTGKMTMNNVRALVDFYPFKGSFHVSAGAYFGSTETVKVNNKKDGVLLPITEYNKLYPNNKVGLALGDSYLLEPDAQGNVTATISTNSVKPYLGLGFGRVVPKRRLNFMAELGVMFWGKPVIRQNGMELEKEKLNTDSKGVVNSISKVSVWPVINFRLCGRIL